MDGQVVAAGQHIAQRDAVLHTAGQAPRCIDGNVGVIAQNFHAQRHGGIGNAGTDGPQADDTQRLAAQFGADKGFLALLHILGNGVAALEGLRPVHSVHHVAAARHQRADDQLCHGVGVGTRRVEHDDAGIGAFLHRDVVGTCTRAGDGQQAVRQRHVVHIGAAHQNTVGLGGLVVDFKLVGRQFGQPNRRNSIQSFDCIHIDYSLFPLLCFVGAGYVRPSALRCKSSTGCHLVGAVQCSLRNFSIKSTSLSMPSGGMAL